MLQPTAIDQTFIGKTYYTRAAAVTSSLIPWARGWTSQPYSYLGMVQPRILSTVEGPVNVVRSSVVNGQRATEYSVPMPAMRESLGTIGTKPLSVGVKPFRFNVWLNQKGRIVLTESKQVVTSGSLTFTAATVVTLSKFGEPVHIVAPTESTAQ
ncbi:MAG: hypothetical protein ABSC90_13675 [Acidimicrobiales bacterium]